MYVCVWMRVCVCVTVRGETHRGRNIQREDVYTETKGADETRIAVRTYERSSVAMEVKMRLGSATLTTSAPSAR